MTPGDLFPGEDGSIILRPSLFETLTTKNAGIVFGFYDKPTLFPVQQNESKERHRNQSILVGTSIIAAKVGVDPGPELQNLSDQVISTFRLQKMSQTGMVI